MPGSMRMLRPDPENREAGESPARSRHCEKTKTLRRHGKAGHWSGCSGKAVVFLKALKSGDLPFLILRTANHADLVWAEYQHFRFSEAGIKKQQEETKMNESKKTNKGLLIGILTAVILVVAIICFILVYRHFGAKPTAGAKHVTLEVVDQNGDTTTYDVHTDAEFLKQVMDETEGFSYSGTDSDYGIMVEVINGVQAIYETDNAYWALYVNGEYGSYGADSQPVTDGDTYTWQYEDASSFAMDDAA